MKRLFNLFLAVVMIFSFTCIQVYAANGTGGSGNIDGGGGSMGDATSHGSWNPGNEGVRVTVVRASDHAVVTTPFDLTNKTPSAGIYHFGKVSKIQYNNGTGLSPVQGGYSYKNPVQPRRNSDKVLFSFARGRERCDRNGHAVFLRPRVDFATTGSEITGISTSSTKLK